MIEHHDPPNVYLFKAAMETPEHEKSVQKEQ